MGETTHISWCDATWNPWLGCQKTGSPACEGCYAEALVAGRFGRAVWGGPHQGPGTRARTSPSTWALPRKLERQAIREGRVLFCFSSSLSDIFDPVVDPQWRADAFAEMRAAPHVIFLLLTKRPHLIVKLSEAAGGLPSNAAIGCTVVTEDEAREHLLQLLAAKRKLNTPFAFVSIEPMIEGIDLTAIDINGDSELDALNPRTLNQEWVDNWRDSVPTQEQALEDFIDWFGREPSDALLNETLDWVIVGGGTDQGDWRAPPMHADWARGLRDQCAAAGVPFHFKQWGEWAPGEIVERQRGLVQVAHLSGDGEWSFDTEDMADRDGHVDDEPAAYRIGKKAAGRTLDGVVHDARPEVRL